MIIHSVRFKSNLSEADALKILGERAPEFRAVPGLVQKFYGSAGDGTYTGIYIFDSLESLANFRESELAKTIPSAYEAEELRVERWEMLGALHEETPSMKTV